jgi:penicillin-binding protein-related factor A (putative recombinase)
MYYYYYYYYTLVGFGIKKEKFKNTEVLPLKNLQKKNKNHCERNEESFGIIFWSILYFEMKSLN